MRKSWSALVLGLVIGGCVSPSGQNNEAAEAERLLNICREHLNAKEFEVAIKSCEKAVIAYQGLIGQELEDNASVETERPESVCLQNLENQELEIAIESCHEEMRSAQNIGDHQGEALSNLSLGFVYLGLERYEEAVFVLEAAIALTQENDYGAIEATSSQLLAIAYLNPELTKKMAEIEQEIEILEIANNSLEQGISQFNNGQFQNALKSLEQALKKYRNVNFREGEEECLSAIGHTYNSLGDYDRAIHYHSEALSISQELEDKEREENAWNSLASSYFNKGIDQAKKFDFQNSLDSSEESLRIYRFTGNIEKQEEVLNNIAVVSNDMGQYDEAIKYHHESLSLSQKIENKESEGTALYGLGNVYSNLAKYDEAIDSYEKAIDIFKELGNYKKESGSINALGVVYDYLGDYRKAISLYEESLEISEINHNLEEQGHALGNLGDIYISVGKYRESLSYQERSLSVFQKINDIEGEANAFNSIGIIYKAWGKLQKAENFYRKSLNIFQKNRDKLGYAAVLSNLSEIYIIQGKYEKVISHLEEALEIQKNISNRRGEAIVLRSLGVPYHKLGNYGKAVEYFESALDIFREIHARSEEGSALNSLCNVYIALGQYEKSIEYCEQSLEIAQILNDKSGVGANYSNLGNIYKILGKYNNAKKYYEQSLSVAQEIENRLLEGISFGNLGSIYDDYTQYDKAILYQEKSLGIYREIGYKEGEVTSLNNLGIIYRSLGKKEDAINYLNESLQLSEEILSKEDQVRTLANLGNVYIDFGHYDKAISNFQEALSIFNKNEINNKYLESNLLAGLGSAFYEKKEYSDAERMFYRSLNIKDNLINSIFVDSNKISFIDTQLNIYKILQSVLIQHQENIEALEISERGRTQVLIETLSKRLADSSQVSLSPPNRFDIQRIAQKEKTTLVQYSLFGRTNNDISELYIWVVSPDSIVFSMIPKITIIFLILEIIVLGRFSYRYTKNIIKSTGLTIIPILLTIGLAHQAQKHSVQIDFRKVDLTQASDQPFDDQIQAAIATAQTGFRDGNQPVETASRGDIAITSLRPGMFIRLKNDQEGHDAWKIIAIDPDTQLITAENFNIPPRTDISLDEIASIDSSSLQTLHQILIDPIADLLPDDPSDRVIFIPQGPLFNLPFAALIDENGDYLIEHHTILTAPSIQTLDLTHKRRQALPTNPHQSALVVGNPTMPAVSRIPGNPPQPLSALPFAETEAHQVADLLNTQAITGSDATKSYLLDNLMGPRIIHLATHGLLDDYKGDAIPGALVLAPPDRTSNPSDPTSSIIDSFSPDSPEAYTNDDVLLRSRDIIAHFNPQDGTQLNAELVVLSACHTGQGEITGDGVLGLSRAFFIAGTPSLLVSLWNVEDDSTATLMTAFYRHWQATGDKAAALRYAMLETMETYPLTKDWAAFTLVGEAF